jgi:hypothetical protein
VVGSAAIHREVTPCRGRRSRLIQGWLAGLATNEKLHGRDHAVRGAGRPDHGTLRNLAHLGGTWREDCGRPASATSAEPQARRQRAMGAVGRLQMHSRDVLGQGGFHGMPWPSCTTGKRTCAACCGAAATATHLASAGGDPAPRRSRGAASRPASAGPTVAEALIHSSAAPPQGLYDGKRMCGPAAPCAAKAVVGLLSPKTARLEARSSTAVSPAGLNVGL